jgi:hypothetical protein
MGIQLGKQVHTLFVSDENLEQSQEIWKSIT